jgi:hypothetical protein
MGDTATSAILIDMSPCDYNRFAKMKEPLRGTRYNTREEIIRAVTLVYHFPQKENKASKYILMCPQMRNWRRILCQYNPQE